MIPIITIHSVGRMLVNSVNELLISLLSELLSHISIAMILSAPVSEG